MPLPLIVKTLTLSITAGSETDAEFTAEKEYTLKKIVVVGRGGADLSNVQIHIEIAGDVLTRPDANAALFAYDSKENPELDITLSKGTRVYVKAKNNGSTDITIDVMFILK